ncbi:hypothetical protein SALBM311S_05394 [Streptomyces alboniger]
MEWREFAERMAELARELLTKESVSETLDEIAASAVKLVTGCDAAGILAVRKGHAVTLSACGDWVRESDRLQGELGEGPCFDLARGAADERAYRIEDMTDPQPSWPRFAEAARDLGIGSMTGVLLYTDKEDFGALNLYSRRPGAFTHRVRDGRVAAGLARRRGPVQRPHHRSARTRHADPARHRRSHGHPDGTPPAE